MAAEVNGGGLQGRSLLLVTFVRFWTSRAGRELRIASLVEMLQSWGLELRLAFVGELTTEDRDALRALGILDVAESRTKANPFAGGGRARGLRAFRRRRGADADGGVTLADCRDARVLRMVAKQCRAAPPDIILAEYARLAYVLEAVPEKAVKVIDTLDVMHRQIETFAGQGVAHGYRVTREEESRALAPFDIVVAIQEREAGLLRSMAPESRVVTCRPSFASIPGAARETPRQRGKRLLFVGSGSKPNVEGVRAFLREIWPAVRTAHPDAELELCGNVCRALGEVADEGVAVSGFVGELAPVYQAADVVVSPVFFGSGIKLKCLEALAYGKACVLSEHSAEGLADGAGAAFLVARDAGHFAQLLSELLADEPKICALETAAEVYMRQHFLHDAAGAALREALEACLEEREGAAPHRD